MKNPWESPPSKKPEENEVEKELALLQEMAEVPPENLRDLESLNKYLEKLFGPIDSPEVAIECALETARLLIKLQKYEVARSFLEDALVTAKECSLSQIWIEAIESDNSKLSK